MKCENVNDNGEEELEAFFDRYLVNFNPNFFQLTRRKTDRYFRGYVPDTRLMGWLLSTDARRLHDAVTLRAWKGIEEIRDFVRSRCIEEKVVYLQAFQERIFVVLLIRERIARGGLLLPFSSHGFIGGR